MEPLAGCPYDWLRGSILLLKVYIGYWAAANGFCHNDLLKL